MNVNDITRFLNVYYSRKPFDIREINENVNDSAVLTDTPREKLDQLLTCHDFETIFKDEKLFWLAYCKAVALSMTQKADFCVSLVGNFFKISGHPSTIDKLKNFIEQLRKIFLDARENKIECRIVVIWYGTYRLLRKESELIDLTNAIIPISEGCNEFDYREFIEPIFPRFVEFFGAVYTEGKKMQCVHEKFFKGTKEVSVIRITWNDEFYLSYPIPPRVIPDRKKLEIDLYTLYQEKKFFGDFTLEFQGDTPTKVCGSLLYLYGGKIIKDLFDDDWIKKENKILLADFSQNIGQLFIDFIYLGEKELSEKILAQYKSHSINISETFQLFKLADFLENKALTDCCTNLISLFAKPEDEKMIRLWAKSHNNEHLTELCNYLSPNQTTIIKV